MNKLKKIFLTAVATPHGSDCLGRRRRTRSRKLPENRHPLLQKDYIQLPLGTIRAEGWMHDQLTRMRDGMTGHLKVYTKVMGPRNGWLGGDGDVWERGPYWIDGLLPLAYLPERPSPDRKGTTLDRMDLGITKAQRLLPAPIPTATTNPVCNATTRKTGGPKMVMLKSCKQYYTATQDRRVIDFMTRYFRIPTGRTAQKPVRQMDLLGRTARRG